MSVILPTASISTHHPCQIPIGTLLHLQHMTPIKISDSKWQVMAIVWEKALVTASDVVDALQKQKGSQSRTIRALLDHPFQIRP